MKKLFILATTTIFSAYTFAKFTVKGIVTDDMDEPVIGATVNIQGTSTGTMTDMDGKYLLDINDSTCVLDFYCTLLKLQEKRISGKDGDTLTVNVKLEKEVDYIICSCPVHTKHKKKNVLKHTKKRKNREATPTEKP